MKEEYIPYPANYFTATIPKWKPLLANDSYKDIIICSLQDLVSKKKNRIKCLCPDSYRDEQSRLFNLANLTEFHSITKPGFFYEIYGTTNIALLV